MIISRKSVVEAIRHSTSLFPNCQVKTTKFIDETGKNNDIFVTHIICEQWYNGKCIKRLFRAVTKKENKDHTYYGISKFLEENQDIQIVEVKQKSKVEGNVDKDGNRILV